MPIEYAQLKDKPMPFTACPKCHRTFHHALERGVVQSALRKFFGMKYCALICRQCYITVGWEKP
jgi:hypothetical protein